jgi:hypothetical protein
MTRGVTFAVALGVAVGGCSSFGNAVRTLAGMPSAGEPSALKAAETRWLLIKNPRFGDVPSEPEYIWVEEDKIPTTFTTVLRGKRAIIATPEVVAKYGSPPGGGRISPRQGVPYATVSEPPAAKPGVLPAAPGPPAAASAARTAAPATPAAPEAPRGWVVYVDTTRIVIDLTAGDGVQAGTVLSLRRDRIPIVHPVTGEVLGELDEEIGTARVTEIRDRFSVAEIQTVAPGAQIQIRDRVVVK